MGDGKDYFRVSDLLSLRQSLPRSNPTQFYINKELDC